MEFLQKKIEALLEKPAIQTKTPMPFQLPITYLPPDKIHALSPIVSSDLELVQAKDTASIYENLLQPKTEFAKTVLQEWNKNYTTDVDFLTSTQQILKEMPDYLQEVGSGDLSYNEIMTIWKDVKEDTFFLEKYGYVEWNALQEMNSWPTFLQMLSTINVLSPLISLALPLLFLILPFLILKFQNIPITFDVYTEVLKEVARNHFIGKALMNIQEINWEKAAYLIGMFGIYLLQIYQNVTSCVRFYNNTKKINSYLETLMKYTERSAKTMEAFIRRHRNKPGYAPFCYDVQRNLDGLHALRVELGSISPFQHSASKFTEMGYMLKCFYAVYSNPEYDRCLRFSFGFDGYLSNLVGICENIQCGKLSFSTFNSIGVCKIQDQYYPLCDPDTAVRNTCDLSQNMIVTGPNASGKTTLLKTFTINVLFSQQFGCGYYKECDLQPYTHIHSYLNIPDTSGRDSLFQAESRRCKEILDIIQSETKGRHFCIFDELYSGTNPEEAAKSAYSFLMYLSKFKSVNFILTTHYTSICSKIKKTSDRMKNYKMLVKENTDGSLNYTYRIRPGISKIKGAVRILAEMNYPKEMLDALTVPAFHFHSN